MQKFTVFSILLSLSIVLGTVDVFFHNYLGSGSEEETTEVSEPSEDTTVDNAEDSTVDSSTEDVTPETDANTPVESTTEIAPSEDSTVELQEEAPVSLLSEKVFTDAGFSAPTLKSALFSGLVFQFIPVSSTEENTFQWNLFDGQNYIGTIYELDYLTDTGSFSAYLDLRDEAGKLTEIGTVNEVNMYGDSSFYFNHKTKVKTVHMVARYGDHVFGFEYANSAHEKMKKVFDILKTLQ